MAFSRVLPPKSSHEPLPPWSSHQSNACPKPGEFGPKSTAKSGDVNRFGPECALSRPAFLTCIVGVVPERQRFNSETQNLTGPAESQCIEKKWASQTDMALASASEARRRGVERHASGGRLAFAETLLKHNVRRAFELLPLVCPQRGQCAVGS